MHGTCDLHWSVIIRWQGWSGADLIEAVPKDTEGLVAQKPDELLQMVQLLVSADPNAHPSDGVDSVLHHTGAL